MFKNKNKFIYFIIFFIIFIISVGTYISTFFKSEDRNTYLEAISGFVTVNNAKILLGDRVKILQNDIIETKDKNSFAIIEWGDGSITRLGGNTKIIIEENLISKNKNNINILFKVVSGKTWSNVISYLGDNSYFKQIFNDNEAAVRGTIFTVDLEKDYIQVYSHKVDLINKEKGKVEIKENKQFQISEFKFISLQDFIRYFKDKKFFEINQKLDKEYFLKLVKDLEKKIGDFSNLALKELNNLTEENKKIIYEKFMEKYQELNFISIEDSEKLFDLKIKLKEKLINLAPDTEKLNILNTLIYDVKNIFDTKKFIGFEKINNILLENKNYLTKQQLENIFNIFNIKFDFGDTIEKSIDIFNKNIINNPEYQKLIDSFKQNFNDTINEQKNIFLKFFNYLKDLFK